MKTILLVKRETRVVAAHGRIEVFVPDTEQGEEQLAKFQDALAEAGLNVRAEAWSNEQPDESLEQRVSTLEHRLDNALHPNGKLHV